MGEIMYDPKADPEYQDPYVDLDEMRTRVLPDGKTISYRYIHGGFRKKAVKFSFCFPDKDSFKNRFFQYLSPFPGPDEELASQEKTGTNDRIAFSLVNGAYFVESNMGSASAFGGSDELEKVWQSSAAVAGYSRIKAAEIYGTDEHIYGFVYGGSGGGFKTMACIENTQVWDGAAPFVIGSPASLPNTITLHAQGQRTLRRVFRQIVDALDAGGSGDMYAGLTEDEQRMLREITEMGFPPQAWFMEAGGRIDDGSLPVLAPMVKMADPGYFKDFWEVPGYLGADCESSAAHDRLIFHGVVKSVHVPGTKVKKSEIDGRNGVDDAWKKALTDGNGAYIELEELPGGEELYHKGTTITPLSGEASGKQLLLGELVRDKEGKGGYLIIGMCYGMEDLPGVLSKIRPGDEVLLDNSDYIAIQSYYRHQVPEDPNFHAWDQFRDADGSPVLPQRRNFLGSSMTGTGTVQDGNIQGKVIVTQSLMDESTCPWCGAWYRDTVRGKKGNEDDFRIYYMQRCLHNDDSGMDNNMVIDYQGALKQAVLDLADWVQYGKEPLESTDYEQEGGYIRVTRRGHERGGMQAEIILTANGEKCAHVKVGEEVTIQAYIEVPQNAGEVTSVCYDFKDVWTLPDPGAYPINGTFTRTLENGIHGAVSSITHVYDQPGTYFASARVTTNRYGDENAAFTQVKNLDRVRVIVEE